MPSSPVFLQSIEDRLRAVRNDYSECEALFQTGADLPLVDVRSARELPADDLLRITRTREHYFREILYGGANILGISIVIPIRGAASVLAECLMSLGRQNLVQQRSSEVEVIVVEDGTPEGERSVFSDSQVDHALRNLTDQGVCVVLLRLRVNCGRAQARNCGLSRVTRPLVLFVDGSMILEPNFLADHVWRHTRLQTDVALLGFKQNLDWTSFINDRSAIASGKHRPDFTKDLKWAHTLVDDEGGFEYKGQYFRSGDTIPYMTLTSNFKALTGIERIGLRTLPSFFQTNVVSVLTRSVKAVGGFVPQMQGWGLEDTLLGALLVSRGCKLIPCPTSVAFNVGHPAEPASEKRIDLEVSRAKYNDFVSKTRLDEYTEDKFGRIMATLEGIVETIPRTSSAPATRVHQTSGLQVDRSIDVTEYLIRYRQSYADGSMTDAFHAISEAYRIDPNNTHIASRYAAVLMRFGRYNAVRTVLANAKGRRDDLIRGIEAEYLRRIGNPDEAFAILESIADSNGYNIAYEKGMCKLLMYSRRHRISDLYQAVGHLRAGRQLYPQHWWVTTNLAIAMRVLGQRDSTLDELVFSQLESAITAHPFKASARIYRLLYYVMNLDAGQLTRVIAADHSSCPTSMEIACDFFDTVQERVFLMCPEPAVREGFMELLKKWPLPFTLLQA